MSIGVASKLIIIEIIPTFYPEVGTYSCKTRPGMEEGSVQLYTEDHRNPSVYQGRLELETREYVPVTLPCVPSHPSVQVPSDH